jgi:acyl-CoA synthetase (AMP-forming)/AMP-acid ligase II
LISANRPEVLVAMLAAFFGGHPYTPLHPLGSFDDHSFIAQDAEIRVLFYGPDQHDRARELADAGKVERLVPLADIQVEHETADQRAPDVATEDELAWLVYTGGTTGRPKGVMLSHRVMVENILITLAEWNWPEEVRFLAVTPLSHSAGVIALAVLARGGSVRILARPDPGDIARAITEDRITVLFAVPSLLYRLLDHPASREIDRGVLQVVIYGASPMSPDRLDQGIARWGRVFMQFYGQTEAPNTICVLRKEDHTPDRLLACGQPVPGVVVQIQDQDGNAVEVGEIGEICVRGRLVMDGYWKRDEATAEALRGGWLHTGDMGRQDAEGFVYIVDRTKDMIISGGFNIYPREVEDVLMSHPGVQAAAVIGVPDDTWGEAVEAVVVLADDDVTPSELTMLVRDKKGPIYAPKSIEIVSEIPLTPVGKPDKKRLRAKYWAGQGRQVH